MDIIATIKKTHSICEQYGLYTKKKFGQNFIIEPKVVEKIAKTAIIDPNDSVIEIGPGIGALTQFLCLNAKKVYSFEIDHSLMTYWNDNQFQNLEVIFEDFLKTDLESFFNKHKDEQFVVAANLPYYITTPILFKLFELKFKKITVMMQKEVAMRFNASINSKDYNGLSVIAQYKYHTKIEFNVSRSIFMPAPNVDSAIISFVEREDRVQLDELKFNIFVHECFTQRRKTIFNNLRKYPSDVVLNILNQLQINPQSRAQELSVDQFIKLFLEFKRYNIC